GDDWPTYGHDKGAMRFSPLDQIKPANVNDLRVAWVYRMKPADSDAPVDAGDAQRRVAEGAGAARASQFAGSEMTPLVIGGRMYISTPYSRVAALDATTGKEIWVREIPGPGQPSLRGVEYWPGDGKIGARIVFGTRDGRLIALDAATGAYSAGFGDNGVVNMKTPEVMNGMPNAMLGMTTPPIVYQNLIITGSSVQENPPLGASGDVRAWDARTGKLVWTFHTVPRKGERGYDTWAPGSTEKRSGVNVWGFISVDAKRGIVYLPIGAPTFDRYGGDRKGDNLFSSSLVAADARTGKYLWHFQVVHHDIWDIDLESAPLLFDAHVGGRTVPAVAVIAKNALLFMLDRVTGKPIHPVEERPVPPSEIPGEVASPTQPFPITPPLARSSFSIDKDVADVTPELKTWCENWIRTNKMVEGGLYKPMRLDQTVITFPGNEGGSNWGGAAFDPTSGYLFVNTNDFGLVTTMVKSNGALPYAPGGLGGRFQQQGTGLMCQRPPWGQLSAVDTATGKIVWQSVLGITDSLPEGLRNTGRHGTGGAIVTAGGLLFIGSTDDSRFRAFETRTGKEVWTMKLEASAHATPISYRGADGRQYVAVVSTGGSYHNSPRTSDALTAFALPSATAPH
ncbi:MAG: Quinoprotein glucose dehydrogenase, partial [Sphingomonas bacterium]|uniref:pyrroloquinoline quinone-dependent dehydrogenase n=1 Tax=Sphingomonas bacterium TaxID=1895847 RepID=UPI00260E7E73